MHTLKGKVMRFIEVSYLEKVPYPTRFGPGSDKPLPPRYKLVSDRRQIIDLDKVVCADTFHGVLIEDPKESAMSNLYIEFIEFVYGENIRVVTLNPENYLGLLLDDGPVQRNDNRKFIEKNEKFNDGKTLSTKNDFGIEKDKKDIESWN